MARAANDVLGVARCPLCGGNASARLSGKGLAYLVMDCCGAQLFSRSGQADQLVRDLIKPAAKAAPAPAAKPEPTPTPAADPKPAATPAPTPEPEPAPVRTEKRRSLGFFPVE